MILRVLSISSHTLFGANIGNKAAKKVQLHLYNRYTGENNLKHGQRRLELRLQ